MVSAQTLIAGAVFFLLPIALLSGRVGIDVIALLALGALLGGGLLTPEEAFSGFASPTILVLVATRALASALERTGATDKVGEWIAGWSGNSERKAIFLVFIVTAIFSSCMSNLITVALLLPSVLVVARRGKIPSSLLLLPLAFGALLGGMCTLIGTAPNLVASDLLRSKGFEPFHFFTFTPFGVSAVLVGAALFVLFGHKLLPRVVEDRSPHAEPLAEVYRLNERLVRLRVPVDSPVVGQTLQNLKFTGTIGGRVVAIVRQGHRNLSPKAHDQLLARDELLVVGRREEIEAAASGKLELATGEVTVALENSLVAVVEAIITPRSALVGSSLADAHFSERYDFSVIAVWREGKPIRTNLGGLVLNVGDALLLQGPREKLNLIEQRRDLVIVSERSSLVRRHERRWLAVGAFLLMLVLSLTGLQSAHIAAFFAALLVIVGGAVRMEEIYRDVEWRIVVFVASVLPLGVAIERSGFVTTLMQWLDAGLGGHSPIWAVVVLGLLASALSQILDSAVAVVMLAPFVFTIAASMNIDPRILMMIVALGSSITFLAPFSSKSNLLVMGVAGYRPGDFFRAGWILSVLLFALFFVAVPFLMPLLR